MNPEAYLVIATLAAAVLAFSFEWLAPEIVAVVVLVLLTAAGVVTPEEALTGFSSNAVVAIGALLVVSEGLVRSGAVKWLADRFRLLAGTSRKRLLLVSTAAAGLLSGFINIIASVSILIPAVLRLGRRAGVEPSTVLLPMVVSGLLGANLSLIGTSHNLVVNDLLQQQTRESFGIFEFAPIGLILSALSIVYALLFSKILLAKSPGSGTEDPRKSIKVLTVRYELDERLWEILVRPDSPLSQHSLEELSPGKNYGLSILTILRKDRQIPVDTADTVILPDDVLALSGRPERVEKLLEDHDGLVLMGQPEVEEDFSWSAFDLIEVVVPPRSPLIGKTLRSAKLRSNEGLIGIGLWRGGRPYRTDIMDRELQAGDGVLLFGSRSQVRSFNPEPDLLWLHRPRKQEAPAHLRKFAPLAGLTFLAVILCATLGILSIAVASLAGAAAMIIIGIMTPRHAYKSIDWRTLILIGGMYPVGAALQKTGVATQMAELVIQSAGAWGHGPALVAIGFLTLVLTQPLHNAVAAVIATPVALQVAEALNANPKTFALAVIVGASASFMMPVGHPAPLLVQKPGGYRNLDYFKYGIGAALLTLLVIAMVIPLLWPLSGS